jgi:hypothetical protein
MEGFVDLIATCSEAIGDLSDRRLDQVRGWAAARLLESFGTVGHAALSPTLLRPDSPFASLVEVEGRARSLVHECLKNF